MTEAALPASVMALLEKLGRTAAAVESGEEERAPLLGLIGRAPRRLSAAERLAKLDELVVDAATLAAGLRVQHAAYERLFAELAAGIRDLVVSRGAQLRELERKRRHLEQVAAETADQALGARTGELGERLDGSLRALAQATLLILHQVGRCRDGLVRLDGAQARQDDAIKRLETRVDAHRAMTALEREVAQIEREVGAGDELAALPEDLKRCLDPLLGLLEELRGVDAGIREAVAEIQDVARALEAARTGDQPFAEVDEARVRLLLGSGLPRHQLARALASATRLDAEAALLTAELRLLGHSFEKGLENIDGLLRLGLEDSLGERLKAAGDAGTPAAWRAFLTEFPDGTGADAARRALAALEAELLSAARAGGEPAPEAGRVRVRAGAMGTYAWGEVMSFAVPGRGSLVFEAWGSNDVHVAIAEKPDDAALLYEIVIGGWSNTRSVVRRGRQTPHEGFARIEATQNPRAVLQRDSPNVFWVSVDRGLVEVGRGEHVGREVFLSWRDPSPLDGVRHVGFSAWDQQVEYAVRSIGSRATDPWRAYLLHFPDGAAAGEAREALARAESEALRVAREAKTPENARTAWEVLLRRFPESAASDEAREGLLLAEAQAWKRPHHWRAYLQAFPEGRGAAEARAFLEGIDWVPHAWAHAWGEDARPNGARWFALHIAGSAFPRFRLILPGTFAMGSPADEAGRDGNPDKERLHEVTLTRPFWIADTPCTQALWQPLMGTNPSRFAGPERPVEGVAWTACQEFLRVLGERIGAHLAPRLPTEAEWEYVCRAGSDGPHAGTGVLRDMGWFDANAGGETHPVAQLEPNPWGLYDTHGNVWEWCADGPRHYSADPVTDPVGPSGGSAVLRGGCFESPGAACRSADRKGAPVGRPADQASGFRIVLAADVPHEGPVEALATVPDGALFLGDLKPLRLQVVDKIWVNDWDGQVSVFAGGRRCTQFVGIHAPASVTWGIPPGARRFTAVGAGRNLASDRALARSWAFQVLVDGKLVVDSPPLRERRGGIPIDIALPPGAATLTIRLDPLGDAHGDHAALAWPCFHGRPDMLAFIPAGAVCLGDLRPLSVKVGWREFCVDSGPGGEAMPLAPIRGRIPDRFIYTYPNAELRYEIPVGATRFTGVGARANWTGVEHGTWKYTVLVDGVRVFDSAPFHEYSEGIPIDVMLPPRARELTITTDALGDTSNDWSFLAWPCFHFPAEALRKDQVALRAADGRFLSVATGPVRALAHDVAWPETFHHEGAGDLALTRSFGSLTLVHAGGGARALLTREGRFLSVGAGGEVVVGGTTLGGGERLTFARAGMRDRGVAALGVDVSNILEKAALRLHHHEAPLRFTGDAGQAREISPPPRMNERSLTVALWISPAGAAPSTWLGQVSPPGGFELWTTGGWLIWGAPALALAVTIWPGCVYHVAVVVDGLEQRLFVDGERLGEATGALALSESAPLVVGDGSAGRAQGLVKEVLVLDRALSDVEVLALYARTR